MVTIDLNGYIVNAATLKEAQRLARIEQKRQDVERKKEKEEQYRQNKYVSIAYDRAFAALGRIVMFLEKNDEVLSIVSPTKYATMPVIDGYGAFLRIAAPGQSTKGKMQFASADHLQRVITTSAGFILGFLAAWGDDAPAWYTVGTWEGVVAHVEVPPSVALQLYELLSRQEPVAA